jgi:Kdo2-lipid IVA lauroyltransferase/acyltransferase
MIILTWISKLPLSLLYGISDFLFFVGYRLIKYRRAVVWRNLVNSFPEKTNDELRQIEKNFYRNLCDYAVETLKLLTISKEELRSRMVYKNLDLVKEYVQKNQSVIYLASHQFNWEWLLAAGPVYLHPAIDFVYQPQSSEFFNRFSLITRTRFGTYPVKRAQVAREAIKRKGLVRGVAIVCDQFPGLDHDKRFWTRFLNQDTAFFQAINQLGVLTQYPVMFGAVRKIKRGYYETEMVLISTPPYSKEDTSIIENYIKTTEKIIREQPEGWLWSHDRWKKSRPLGE